MISSKMPLPLLPLGILLLLSNNLAFFSYAKISFLPSTATTKTSFFLGKSQRKSFPGAASIVVDIRGGSDSVYEEDDEEEEEEANATWEQGHYDADEDAITDHEMNTQDDGEEKTSSDDESQFVRIDQEEIIFEDEVEEEDEYVVEVEEQIFEDAQVEEEEAGEGGTEESFHDALQEEVHDEPAPLTQVLEERMATTTDDESSAFVDRMDLADAYDEGETTTATDESTAIAAATAARVSGGGVDEEKSTDEKELVEITEEMKTILRKDLKYTARDVKLMRPDVAAMVVAKGLRRPIEGMPPSFYLDGASPSPGLRKSLVKVSLTIFAVGAIAILGLNGNLATGLSKPFSFIAAVPKKSNTGKTKPSIVETSTTEAQEDTVTSIPITDAPSQDDKPTTAESSSEVDEEKEPEDDHAHSVKPYSAHVPSYEEDLDKTWLDKLITRIENAVKAFFRIEI